MNWLQKALYLAAGMALMAMLSSGVVPAMAALVQQQITVHTGITIFIDGEKLRPVDVNGNLVEPLLYEGTTYLPVRAVGEALGRSISWDGENSYVYISETDRELPNRGSDRTEGNPLANNQNRAWAEIESWTIIGSPQLNATQLNALARRNNPNAPDLAELYLEIGKIYGIRGDLAFCQAAKETGWWKYGGLVLPEQNNYCGLYATGKAIVGDESLYGADPNQVELRPDYHGAWFSTPAAGVEAHIQHLYAYASSKPLPSGRSLLDPRFSLIKREQSLYWVDLGGKWAVPGYDRDLYDSFEAAYAEGQTYGHSIIMDYYLQTN